MEPADLRIYAFISVFVTAMLIVPAYAQYGYGTSSITLNPAKASIQAGSSASVQYNVNLASGNTWGTDISVSNAASLSSQGVTVTFSNPSGDPPFSGTATITASKSTAGNYTIDFVATGDDPSSQPAVFSLDILSGSSGTTATTAPVTTETNSTSKNTTKNTTSVQTTAATYNTTAPTTVPYTNTQQQSNAPLYVSILAVIVLFAVIIAAFRLA